METRFKILKSYRGLVRAARITFRGDDQALNAARERIRSEYAPTGPIERPELLQRLQLAKDVAHILRRNVVQGVRNENNAFKLGLHKDSELGDNDDRLKPVQQSTEFTGCCGGQSTA